MTPRRSGWAGAGSGWSPGLSRLPMSDRLKPGLQPEPRSFPERSLLLFLHVCARFLARRLLDVLGLGGLRLALAVAGLRQVAPAGVGLALLHDAQEQFFQRRGRVAQELQLA